MVESNLSDTELIVMIIRMLNNMKAMETIKKDQSEMKTTVSEMNNTLEGINRLDRAEDRISDLENKVRKKPPNKSRKGKKIKK